MSDKADRKQQYVVVCDGWTPDRYFDLNETDEMQRYLAHCRRNYQGQWDYKVVDKSFPRKFQKVILNKVRQ